MYPHKVSQGGTLLDLPFVVGPQTQDYGVSGTFPYYSASLPFAADAVVLDTTGNQPFMAFYDVAARLVEPQLLTTLNYLG